MTGNNSNDETESSSIHGWGSGRRNILTAIEEATELPPVDEFDSLDDVLDAVRDISLETESFTVRSEPTDVLETIARVHANLPDGPSLPGDLQVDGWACLM